MKILFLSKRTKWCNKAKEYIERNFDDVTVAQGEWGDKFPEKLNNWQGDYIISYLSPWIISEKLLKKAKIKAINFHPGTPKFPGIGGYNFAIYNEEKEYGVLCHKMEKEVDSGKIIKVRKFPITTNETVISLKEKSMENLLNLFYEMINLIKNGKGLPAATLQWEKNPRTRKDLQELCKINLKMTEKEILKRIRATYYPGGPDFPYLGLGGKKIILKEISLDGMENASV